VVVLNSVHSAAALALDEKQIGLEIPSCYTLFSTGKLIDATPLHKMHKVFGFVEYILMGSSMLVVTYHFCWSREISWKMELLLPCLHAFETKVLNVGLLSAHKVFSVDSSDLFSNLCKCS
jgi:hypothetical protein